MLNNKDVPVDIVSDQEFNDRWATKADGSWRGYAAGTPTEQRRESEAAALQDALKLAENTRQFNESLGEQKREADMDYAAKMFAASRSGGGGGGGLTAKQQYDIMRDMKLDAEKTRQFIINEAAERTKNDSRLAGGKVSVPDQGGLPMELTTQAGAPAVDEDGKPLPIQGQYYTSAQLMDAHLRDLINQYGLDPADFGLQPLTGDGSQSQWGNFRQLDEKSKNQAQNW